MIFFLFDFCIEKLFHRHHYFITKELCEDFSKLIQVFVSAAVQTDPRYLCTVQYDVISLSLACIDNYF